MGLVVGPQRVSRSALVTGDEEGRAYLQSRLEVLSRLMFWSCVVLLASVWILYWKYPAIKPRREPLIFGFSVGGLALLAIVWRVVLTRRAPRLAHLHFIDLFFAFLIGSIFGARAYLALEFQPAAYASLLFASFMVFTRAIVLPSSGARTVLAGVIAFIPMTVAALAIALNTRLDLPGPAFVIGCVTVGAIVIAIATIGSRIIYGLQKKITAVMQLGQYMLDGKIGEGGNGAVYRARHVMLKRPTAVKILRPEIVGTATLARFEREVQHMSQLTHPNTVAVFDYGRNHEGVFYYAMEYLDGIDLEALVERYGAQPADRVVAILVQVCGALGEAHRKGIMHRDIKPANIILCERGGVPDVAKVVDFGLVKEITAETGESSRVILGTPSYIAPEAVTDPDVVGPPADIYALGAVGYFLLTGKRVFEGKTSVDVCVQHVTAAPPPMSSVGGDLEALVMKCLAKQPATRPGAYELSKLLHALPQRGDWNEEQALRWWENFRKHAAPASTSVPTLTISVDLIAHARESSPTP